MAIRTDGQSLLRRIGRRPAETAPNIRASDEARTEKEMRGEHRPVVAELTGDELGAWEDVRQLGRKAEAWYRNNLAGTKATNAETGWVISFNTAGAKKVGGRKGDVLARIVPAIPDIISKGRLIRSEPDTKGRSHIKRWHTFAARVNLAGAPRHVVVKVAETSDGKYHYDLSRDAGDGALFYRNGDQAKMAGRGSETAIGSEPYGFEDNPVKLNIDLALSSGKIDAAVSPIDEDGIRAVARRLNDEIAQHGLDGKVGVRAIRKLLSASGVPVLGSYRRGQIRVDAQAVDPDHVARHEIIHALRDDASGASPMGCFPDRNGVPWCAQPGRMPRLAVQSSRPILMSLSPRRRRKW
ncbi:LPD3 domain-containing protein [Paenirhodobacter populi]|uniref:Large polyvalent protein-associated domain-containing protein n=1 Tax=Paenirhodobacter populi TaxID=2306993 RepID=A0A443ISW1_9RHOB|nr:hypothetical protein [Sinirhodobacter populi]RWR10443.1 hypothetical protein D2T33_12325 [Sinirhodobacter populi]